MKLTRRSDYALRLSILLAVHSDRLVSISEMSETYALPRGNVMKIVMDLAGAGILETVRGRAGGVRLARQASKVSLAQIVEVTENTQALVDCSSCVLAPNCGLICVLEEAKRAFFSVLDAYSLQDVVDRNPKVVRLVESLAAE